VIGGAACGLVPRAAGAAGRSLPGPQYEQGNALVGVPAA